MIVGRYKQNSLNHVTFINYDGRYPNLCSGTLKLAVNGIEHIFSDTFYCNEDETHHKRFWSSGGGLDSDYCAYDGEWIIDYCAIPENMRAYADEIDILFNENVEHGCCGGCA